MSFEILLSKTYSLIFGAYFIATTMILAYKIGRDNKIGVLSDRSELFKITLKKVLMEAAMFGSLIILINNLLDSLPINYYVIIPLVIISNLIVRVMIMVGQESYRKQFLPSYHPDHGKSFFAKLPFPS